MFFSSQLPRDHTQRSQAEEHHQTGYLDQSADLKQATTENENKSPRKKTKNLRGPKPRRATADQPKTLAETLRKERGRQVKKKRRYWTSESRYQYDHTRTQAEIVHRVKTKKRETESEAKLKLSDRPSLSAEAPLPKLIIKIKSKELNSNSIHRVKTKKRETESE